MQLSASCRDLLEQFEPLPRQGRLEIGEPSGVATRPRGACNEAAGDRIAGIDGQATPPCGVFTDCTITAGGYDFSGRTGTTDAYAVALCTYLTAALGCGQCSGFEVWAGRTAVAGGLVGLGREQ